MLFLLGFFAGLVSIFLPRLMLSLSVDAQPVRGSFISFFHADFLILALIFAIFIGIIAVIFEGAEKRASKEIFIAALGSPAILSGVLNTTSATNKLEKAEQSKASAERTLTDLLGIPQSSVNTATVLGTASAAQGAVSSQGGVEFSLFPAALAQSQTVAQQQSQGFDPGIRVDRPGCIVVLKAVNTEEEAKKGAEELRNRVPTAQAIKTDKGLFVVDSASPRSQSDAARDAVRLRSMNLRMPCAWTRPDPSARTVRKHRGPRFYRGRGECTLLRLLLFRTRRVSPRRIERHSSRYDDRWRELDVDLHELTHLCERGMHAVLRHQRAHQA
jgi:hypothetical protein